MALSRFNQPSANPYSVGAIQIDTTPLANLFLQQRQREQAKDEALDKYFIDYDKSINPAGMRNVEAQDLIKLTNENKDFYFRNKANIKNPALDNGQSYNEWMSRNKAALGLVNQSKQNAKKEQLYNKAILDAKKSGNPIPDATIEKLSRFNKSVYDKDYRDIEANDLDFTPKPFDPIKFKRDNYADIKLSESKPEIEVDDKNNQLIFKTVSKLDKANVPVLEQRATYAYQNSPSVKFQVDKIIQDPVQLVALNKVYQKYKGKDINIQQPEQVASALLLSLGDTEKVDYLSKNDPQAQAYLSNQLISSRIQQNATNNFYNPRQHVEEIYNNGSDDNNIYPIKKGIEVKGREISMPDVLQDKYYDKVDGRVRRPDRVIMDDDKKNIHLIFFNGTESNGQPRVDQKKSRSIPVTTDIIPDLEKSFGNPKKNLSFGNQAVSSPSTNAPKKPSGIVWKN
jgi:hypothetical protein